MLLRRVTEHVKTQNWFAVGIDFVIVVIGVFIGIQVANWNDAIEEEREAEWMRASILIDLENEKIVSNILREYWETARAYAEVAVDGFDGDTAVDNEQFVISAYQASQAQFPLSNRATYEQMVASGDINIAGSDEFRLAVVSYYVADWSQSPVTGTTAPYRASIRRAIPHFIQAAIRENCGDQIVKNDAISALALPKSCDLDLPSEAFAKAAASLRERPDLLMDLRHHLSDLDAKLQNLSQLDIQIDNIFSLAGSE